MNLATYIGILFLAIGAIYVIGGISSGKQFIYKQPFAFFIVLLIISGVVYSYFLRASNLIENKSRRNKIFIILITLALLILISLIWEYIKTAPNK